MKKILIFLLTVVIANLSFASSVDLIEKANSRIDDLKSELAQKIGDSGNGYQIAGGFSVNGDNIELKAYIVGQTGEKIINRFEIKEVRNRADFNQLISRTSNIPDASFFSKTKQHAVNLALLIGVVMFAMMMHLSSRKKKTVKNNKKAEKNKYEEENSKAA